MTQRLDRMVSFHGMDNAMQCKSKTKAGENETRLQMKAENDKILRKKDGKKDDKRAILNWN